MTKKIIDYSKTVIYKIISNDLNIKEVYVGSTTNFTKRKCHHKSNCNNINGKKYNYKLYQFIRSNGGWDSFSMIQIEKYICSDGNEARAKERQWFEQLNAKLNMVCPGAYVNGEKEYKKEYNKIYNETNKDTIVEMKKKYYETNKDKIKEKNKNYRQNNKEQIKNYYETNKDKLKGRASEPYLCGCGCVIQRTEKARHQKSQKHNKLMETIKNR